MSSKNDLASSVAFSIASNESTDFEDNPQHAVFVSYVTKHFCVNEFNDLVAHKDTTKGVDIKIKSILFLLKVFPLNVLLSL